MYAGHVARLRLDDGQAVRPPPPPALTSRRAARAGLAVEESPIASRPEPAQTGEGRYQPRAGEVVVDDQRVLPVSRNARRCHAV